MAKGYVIYNPLSGRGEAKNEAQLFQVIREEELEYYDMTRITRYSALFSDLQPDDYVVIVGGDGTLNRFVNGIDGLEITQEIFYLPAGSGNDFAGDVNQNPCREFLNVTRYLKELPVAEVKGKRYRFVNGVGFGIDGYCCQVGDEQKKRTLKKVNYAAIAIQGLLFRFRPRKATVIVDGKTYAYEKVWLAPVMHGRRYGGGMIPTPQQNRFSGELSLMVFHGAGKFRTLCAFPGIFKGEHVKHTDMVTIHTGKEITVKFDRPTPLQIDGETIPDVTEYTAEAAKRAPERICF